MVGFSKTTIDVEVADLNWQGRRRPKLQRLQVFIRQVRSGKFSRFARV
jgi:hypothetical protein